MPYTHISTNSNKRCFGLTYNDYKDVKRYTKGIHNLTKNKKFSIVDSTQKIVSILTN